MKLFSGVFCILCLLASISVSVLVFYQCYGVPVEGQKYHSDSAFLNHQKAAIIIRTPDQVPKQQANRTDWSNPGCREKKLSKYRPVFSGKVYDYPSIVHYAKLTWTGRAVSLNFREYTSVLSVYKFLKPERIIFHTYTDIVGKYWDIIESWKNVQIEVNKISRVRQIGGKSVVWIQHEADYIKLRALHNQGGLTLDFDVIIVNGTKLREEQKVAECVLAEEGEYINGGFHSCVKNSSFIAEWLEGYEQDYRPNLWIHNVSYKPAGLLLNKSTRVCYNVYLDDTISVHPNSGRTKEWLGNEVQWRTKTAAHYFIKQGIPNDGEGLLQENHSLGKLLQYVHQA